MTVRFAARPWKDVEKELQEKNLKYEAERTCPARDFFAIDEDDLYILREKEREDGSWCFVLAARLRKEVSANGLQNR